MNNEIVFVLFQAFFIGSLIALELISQYFERKK